MGMFGGSKTPKAPDLPPPPPPPPKDVDPEVKAARSRTRAIAASNAASSATDLTNGGLSDTPANIIKKKLLGA